VSEATQQRSIVLILARDLASMLATPMLIVDAEGTLIFYNEAAGAILGRPFTEAEPMAFGDWARAFDPRDAEGNPVALVETPLGIVLTERMPAHRTLLIRSVDGVERVVESTAFPLYARADEFVGGVAVFWGKHEEG
jgi:PAS domain-containing protein